MRGAGGQPQNTNPRKTEAFQRSRILRADQRFRFGRVRVVAATTRAPVPHRTPVPAAEPWSGYGRGVRPQNGSRSQEKADHRDESLPLAPSMAAIHLRRGSYEPSVFRLTGVDEVGLCRRWCRAGGCASVECRTRDARLHLHLHLHLHRSNPARGCDERLCRAGHSGHKRALHAAQVPGPAAQSV